MQESYVLYQYASCPFCARVNAFLDHFGIELERRDTLRDAEAQGLAFPDLRRELGATSFSGSGGELLP